MRMSVRDWPCVMGGTEHSPQDITRPRGGLDAARRWIDRRMPDNYSMFCTCSRVARASD
jgi:hypothetical protein